MQKNAMFPCDILNAMQLPYQPPTVSATSDTPQRDVDLDVLHEPYETPGLGPCRPGTFKSLLLLWPRGFEQTGVSVA